MDPTNAPIPSFEKTPFIHIHHGGPISYGGVSEWPILKVRLDLGADPDMLLNYYGKKSTPLMVAAGVSNLVAGRLLIQYGANTKYSLEVGRTFASLPYFIFRCEKKWIEFEYERGLETWLLAEKEAKSVHSASPFRRLSTHLLERIRISVLFLSRTMPDPELYSPNPEFKTTPYFSDSIKWDEDPLNAEIAAKENCDKDPMEALQEWMKKLDVNSDSSSEESISDSESTSEHLDNTPVNPPPQKRQKTKY